MQNYVNLINLRKSLTKKRHKLHSNKYKNVLNLNKSQKHQEHLCKDSTIKKALEKISKRATQQIYSSKGHTSKMSLKGVDGKYVYLGDSRCHSEDESSFYKSFNKTTRDIKNMRKRQSKSPSQKLSSKRLRSANRLRNLIKSYETIIMDVSSERTPINAEKALALKNNKHSFIENNPSITKADNSEPKPVIPQSMIQHSSKLGTCFDAQIFEGESSDFSDFLTP